MRLADLKPSFSRVYKDRHLTADNGGFPTDTYILSFQCPKCEEGARVIIKVGPSADASGPCWQASPMPPDLVGWQNHATISPSINYTTCGHGKKRPPCTFHGSIIDGKVVFS